MKQPATDQERLAIIKEGEERKNKELNTPLTPQGEKKVSKEKEFENYLIEKINGTSFVEYQSDLISFIKYRMSLTAGSRYKTTRGIDGLLTSVGDLIRAGLDPVDCLERTMQEEWLKPKPEYFNNNKTITKKQNEDKWANF